MRHADWPEGLAGDGVFDPEPKLSAWQDSHEPTLTLRMWVGEGGQTMVLQRWSKDTLGDGLDDMGRPFEEMAQAVAAAVQGLAQTSQALLFAMDARDALAKMAQGGSN